MNSPTISELTIYPVKSAAGIRLKSSPLDKIGLRYDRRWMLIDKKGHFLSQRQLPKMALIIPTLDKKGQLSLKTKTMPLIKVPLIKQSINTVLVTIWDTELEAQHLSHDVDQWLSQFLETDCRLVTLADDVIRHCDSKYAQDNDHTSFTDGFPLLLCTQASLDDLNNRLKISVMMTHFRPNIVISKTIPYEEDLWEKIVIGDLSLRVVKPCSRCVITTIDPHTGIKTGTEPLATLATYRKKANKVYFGQNIIPNQLGVLNCGDKVSII